MGIEGEGCMVTTIGIGQRKEAGFETVETLRFFPVPGSAGDAAQVELAPGEYHIVSWNCSRPKGTPSITLGKYQGGNVLGQGGQYTESYGSFRLAAGEIVNLGYLRMVRLSRTAMRLEATDLPPQQHEKLAREKPQLVARMTTRLIHANPAP